MKPSTDVLSPWYREPWPWLLMLGPAVVVVAGVITAWLAFSSSDGLVDDDYYKQGLAVNQRIHRDREAFERGLEAELVLSSDGRQLAVTLRSQKKDLPPPVLTVRLAHPTVAGRDLTMALAMDAYGIYRADVPGALPGRWLVSVEDASLNWRLVGEWQPEHVLALKLGPRSDFSGNTKTRQGG